jgi:hypothetical protein
VREGGRERERERDVKKLINKFTSDHRPAKLPTIAASSIVFISTDQPSCSGKEHGWGRRACVDGKQNGDVLEHPHQDMQNLVKFNFQSVLF